MARSSRATGRAAPPPEVMTISDLAEYLQVSKSSLYKLVQQGKVPGQKVGKHWRFSRASIDKWLDVSGMQKSG
jgi:excisionase family DNA binding protein